MKSTTAKSLLTFLTLTLSITVFAQDRFEIEHHYKPFKVDAGMGYARPAGKGAKAGVLLYMEPKVNLLDRLAVGIRTEATAMARGNIDRNGTEFTGTGEAGLSLSFLGTADYYFTNRLVRPYIGGGAGIYNLLGVEGTTDAGGNITIPKETKFGGVARAGLEIWHLRAGVEYNFVSKSGQINNNYLGLKIGIVFGGGVKDRYRGTEE